MNSRHHSRHSRGPRSDSNFSRRHRDDSPNQDRYGSSLRGDERQHQMNRYPHSYSEYDSHRDMENRRFGASEGDSYLVDRSHETYSDAGEMYRPSIDESSRMSSGYGGRGPKGYKRSDERIKEEVCELLTRDSSIDAEDIEVDVKDGEVTLTGTVPDRRMKRIAEDCVERALGVVDVMNSIRVKRASTSTTSSDTGHESLTGDRTII